MKSYIPYLYLYAGMTLVGSYVALSKSLLLIFPVFLLAGLRFAIAAVAMWPWLKKDNSGELNMTRDTLKWLFILSLFGNFLFSICMLNGVARTTATAAGVIMSLLPAAVAVLSRVFLKETLSRNTWLALVLAVISFLLLHYAREGGDGAMISNEGFANDLALNSEIKAQAWLGNLLLLGAVFCEAVYVVVSKRLSATVSPKRMSALINVWGLGLMLPFAAMQAAPLPLQWWASINHGTWGLLLFYALAASMVSTWLWMTGLRHVPASKAGVFTVALPIASACVGVWLYHEPFTWLHGFAMACAGVGIVLMTRNEKNSEKQAEK